LVQKIRNLPDSRDTSDEIKRADSCIQGAHRAQGRPRPAVAWLPAEIGVEEKVPVIRRIHVGCHLKAATEKREIIEKVQQVYHHSCPVSRSRYQGIDITPEFVLEEGKLQPDGTKLATLAQNGQTSSIWAGILVFSRWIGIGLPGFAGRWRSFSYPTGF